MKHDHETLEEFVRDLATATVYDSHDAGHVITEYWRDEAIEWVKDLDTRKVQRGTDTAGDE